MSDISAPDLLFATPIFPDVARGIFQSLIIPDNIPDDVIILSWNEEIPHPFLKPGAEFQATNALAGMLLAPTEQLAFEWKEHICVQSTHLPKPARRDAKQELFRFGPPVEQRSHSTTVSVIEESRYPDHSETISIVAFPVQKRLFVNGQQPFLLHQRHPDWTIKSFAITDDFDGCDYEHLTEVIIAMSLRLNRPVALRLNSSDSLR